jgi:hypothetical protein
LRFITLSFSVRNTAKIFQAEKICFQNKVMFGLGDISIAIAMLGSVAVSIVCVVYGIITWNKGDDSDGGQQ